MASKLDGSRIRIDRSKEIIDILNREVLDFFRKGHPYRVTYEPVTEGCDEHIIFLEPPTELPERWPLLIGECLHEVRSALDNLVWMLAESHSGPAPWPIPPRDPWRRVQFPVRDSYEAFDEATKAWGSLLDPEDLAILRAAQPVDGEDRDYLRRLSELNNADKHRAIPLLVTFHRDLVRPQIWVEESHNAEIVSIEVLQSAGPCAGKTELGRMVTRDTGPDPWIKLKEAFELEIGIDHPMVGGMDAVGVLMWIQIHARGIIDRFSTRYPDEAE